MGCEQSKANDKPPLSPPRMNRIIRIETNEKTGIDSIANGTKPLTSKPCQDVQVHTSPSTSHHMNLQEFQEALKEYKKCEANIIQLESEDPLTLYYIKKSHLESISNAIHAIQEKIRMLLKTQDIGLTEKEFLRADGNRPNNLRKIISEFVKKDIISKSDQERLIAANRLEIAGTEIEMLQQEKALVENEISVYKAICIKLIILYNKQDEISKTLTRGISNPEEQELYRILAEVECNKIKLSEAYQRWREARSQIIDACRQFGVALKKWREIKDGTTEELYDLAEEVRDDLVTSFQCITNAKFYIRLELPYCSTAEMVILEKALSYIFIDINTIERRIHADSCYKAFHNRAVALFAWVNQTIVNVIEPVLKKVGKELAVVSQQVKEARFHAIRNQFPNVSWQMTDDENDNTDYIDSGNFNLTDSESVEAFRKLDTTLLADSPTIENICGKTETTNNTNYKSMFVKNATPETQSLIENGVAHSTKSNGINRVQ